MPGSPRTGFYTGNGSGGPSTMIDEEMRKIGPGPEISLEIPGSPARGLCVLWWSADRPMVDIRL